MFFGESITFIDINEQLQIQSYIENYFLESILNESVEGSIENEIAKLKKKDPKEITKEDFDKIIKRIKRISDDEVKSKALVKFAMIIIPLFGAAFFPLVENYFAAIVCFVLSDIASIWTLIDDIDGGEKVMRALMKFEAKLNIKKSKLDNEEEIKNIDEIIKYIEELKKALRRTINKNTRKSVNEAYKGNAIKTDVYKQILNEVEDLVEAFKARIEKSYEIAEKQLKELEKAKDSKSLNNAIIKIRDIGNQGGDEIAEISETICGKLTWKMFWRDTEKFVNKYSITSFDNKRALASKLTAASKQIKDQGDKYFDKDGEFVKRLLKSHDKAAKINIELADRGYKVILSWLNYSIDESNATFKDIQYVLAKLDISGSTRNFLFKLLNGKELFKRSEDDYDI